MVARHQRTKPVRERWWQFSARLAIILAVMTSIRVKYRWRVWGDVSHRGGGRILVTNHQHDLESVVLPGLVTLRDPWHEHVVAIASERLFETGFLVPRVPPWLIPLVRQLSLGRILYLVGALPLENEPRSRTLHSWAHEVQAVHGNMPLVQVFSPEALTALHLSDLCPDNPYPLSAMWGAELAQLGETRMSLLALNEPYRTEVRTSARPRIERQFSAIEDALRNGATLYLTPEGRVSPDGRLGRFRLALDRLMPEAEGGVYLAGVSYEPFLFKKLTLCCHIVRAEKNMSGLPQELLAIRPVTVSQLLAEWMADRQDAGAFNPEDVERALLQRLSSLPSRAFLVPELTHFTRSVVERALKTMTRLGYLEPTAGGYRRTAQRHDERLHEPPDVFSHQVVSLKETLEALSIPREAAN